MKGVPRAAALAAAAAALLLACAARGVTLLRDPGQAVELTPDNYGRLVIDYPSVALVFFHATEDPTQGPFRKALQQLDLLAKKYEGLATIGYVNCHDGEAMEQICRKTPGMTKLPSARVFYGPKLKNPYADSSYRESWEHDGLLSARELSIAIQSRLVDESIARIKSLADWENWVDADSTLPKVLVFTEKMEPTVLVKGLAMHYNRRLNFAIVANDVVELLDEFDIDTSPAVVLRKVSGEAVKYRGAVNAVDLQEFLSKHAPERLLDEVNRKNLEDTAPIFAPAPQYRNVSLAEVPHLMEKAEDVWALFFFNRAALDEVNTTCLAPLTLFANFTRDAGNMFFTGLVALAPDELPGAKAVGADPDFLAQDTCNFQLLVKPFGDEIEAEDMIVYSGAPNSKAVINFMYEQVPEFTVHMTMDALAGFVGMAPGGNSPFSPKAVLITNKEEVPGMFKVLATNFRKRDIHFGWVSTKLDPEVAKEFEVPRVPFLLVIYIDPTVAKDDKGQVPLKFEPFNMPMKFIYMENFLDTIVERVGRASDQGGADDDKEEFSGSVRHAAGPVPQVSSNADLAARCTDRGGLCAIALLDAAADGHQQRLDLLQLLANNRKDQAVQFSWVNAARQRTFLQSLGVPETEVPTLLLLSPRKLRFSRLMGRFDQPSLNQFIDRLLAGQVATQQLRELPALVDGGEAAAVEEPAADEFDLSDILAEDVQDAVEDRATRLAKAEEEMQQEAARAAEEAKKARTRTKKKKSKKSKKSAKKSTKHEEL